MKMKVISLVGKGVKKREEVYGTIFLPSNKTILVPEWLKDILLVLVLAELGIKET